MGGWRERERYREVEGGAGRDTEREAYKEQGYELEDERG